MSDRNTRSDRLSKRFQQKDDDADAETESEASRAEEESESKSEPESASEADEQVSVKERPSVLMYLPDDVRTELDIRFDELNARHKREHGEPLEKNRDYYPAVVQSGLTGDDLEDILGL
ncbi:hypothetical protein [Halocalculus aciditolerans]|uniref:DUF8160 domain-containing protein n=1 Tax=Halocalculus aciditolerans TaxID=1383812 RepID=A0A830FPH8_9EURY|nr:hypothetical protein [Halocalculus aciditolerans]GGL67665.1 hypothetical protein GCM10009039_27030 [Halocalculus aciditolerans]